MKRSTLCAIAMSFMLSVFVAAPAISADERAAADQQTASQQQQQRGAAGQQDMSKQQQRAVKQTQTAIDNLKSALRSFQQQGAQDEHFKEAANSTQEAIEKAEKALEHARMSASAAGAPGARQQQQQRQMTPGSERGAAPGGTTGGSGM